MKRIPIWLFALMGPVLFAARPRLQLRHLRGPIYLVEDSFFTEEFLVVYLGGTGVMIVGATWIPEIAKLLATAIAQVTPQPIREVVNTNYHPDRAGGNAFFKNIGAHMVATRLTDDLMVRHWDRMVRKSSPNYPLLPLVRTDTICRTSIRGFESAAG